MYLMNTLYGSVRKTDDSAEKQEKLKILATGFGKLEESRKDYIRELTRKLADIHCDGEFRGRAFQEGRIAFPNTHCSKGFFV